MLLCCSGMGFLGDAGGQPPKNSCPRRFFAHRYQNQSAVADSDPGAREIKKDRTGTGRLPHKIVQMARLRQWFDSLGRWHSSSTAWLMWRPHGETNLAAWILAFVVWKARLPKLCDGPYDR